MSNIDDSSNSPDGHLKELRRVTWASLVGTVIEWYDFYLYGTASALIFGKLFFPEVGGAVATFLAFATFASGFVARPIGAVFFGHFGDRWGRKRVLMATMIGMGGATTLMGVVPTYASLGPAAAIVLVSLRVLQGFSVGGEWGGASIMVTEFAPTKGRGFYASLPQMGISAGLLLANLIYYAFFLVLAKDQFMLWGWRIPFLLSLGLVVGGLYLRLRISETPVFEQLRIDKREARIPFIQALRTHPRSILIVMGMRICENAFAYLGITFGLAYATDTLGLSEGPVLIATLVAAAVAVFTWPAAGALSDSFGRRRTFFTGAVVAILLAFPFFWLLDSRSMALVWLAIILAWAVGSGLMTGIVPAFYAEQFEASIRYTGISFGYQIGALLGGGIAPSVSSGLLLLTNGQSWSVSLYIIFIAIISIVTVFFAKELSGRPLPK